MSTGFHSEHNSAGSDHSPAELIASQHSSDKRKHTTEISETAKLLLAGGVAGALSKTATAPLARLTILYQVCMGTLDQSSTESLLLAALP